MTEEKDFFGNPIPQPTWADINDVGYCIHEKIFGPDEIGRWKMDVDWKVKCRELAQLLILRKGINGAKEIVRSIHEG